MLTSLGLEDVEPELMSRLGEVMSDQLASHAKPGQGGQQDFDKLKGVLSGLIGHMTKKYVNVSVDHRR